MHRSLCSGLLALMVLTLIGCGGSVDVNRPKRSPVSGVVTYKQQPVEGATVIFIPVGSTPGAAARTDASGRFQLQTFDPNDGAVPGDYRVTVQKVEITTTGTAKTDDEELPPGEQRSLIPEKYGVANLSGLTATVADGGENSFSFDLQGEITGRIPTSGARASSRGE